MKITEIITEVFNPETSFPIEWDDRHGPEEMHGRAYDRQGGFIDIKFIALRNGVVEVEFSRNDSYDMTGAGDANRVLATILEAFREYLRGYRPKIFVFSAKGGSRSRVYQSMIERFAAGAGYKQFDTAKLSDKARKQLGHSGSDVMVLRRAAVEEDRHPNDTPYGPETKPTMPKGTVRVDVSDVYDWYKLGMNISNLDKDDKSQFGKGPPSTIVSFGDEDTEHKYIKDLEKLGLTTTDIDPVDPNQPRGMKRQKVDPTFNVNESNDGKPLWHINSYDNFETAFEIDLVIDGKDIGFFSYQYDPEQDTVENDIRIINDSERGHGYGKLLLLKAIETAQQHNLPYKRDHRGTSSAQSRVYSSLINDGIIKVGHDKTITLTGKNLSTTKEKNPRFSLIAQGQYVGHFDDHEDAKREADRIANDPNSKYPLVSVKDNSSKLVSYEAWPGKDLEENFADGKVKGKSRPGRVKRAGASCNGSVTDLRARAKNASGEKAKMYHWCANMKSGRKK